MSYITLTVIVITIIKVYPTKYYGKFKATRPGCVQSLGANLEFLRRQSAGLTGNFEQSGYPFDTPMWNGGVGVIKAASIIHDDPTATSPGQDAWWPYEQTAYLLDGILKLGILLDDKEKISLFERNLRWLVDHPGPDGRLGDGFNCDLNWPLSVFFRAAQTWCEYIGDNDAKQAFYRHYSALSAEEIACGFRHICTLEGLLDVYVWTGDSALLAKAELAYSVHNRRNNLRTDDEYELHFDRIGSERNYIIHGVTFSEELKLPVLLYMYTGKTRYLEVAERGLAEVLRRHEQLPGLPSSNEDFAGRDPLQGYETCVINDFCWMLRTLLLATGKGEYADRIEKIVSNALPGAVMADFTTLQYLSSPNQVIVAPEANHTLFYRGSADFRQLRASHAAQCCPGNVHHTLPNYVMSQFLTDVSGAPVAALYGAAEFSGVYRNTRFRIVEETNYPRGTGIKFRFELERPLAMPFSFRIPGWCVRPTAEVNAAAVATELIPGRFVTVEQVWNHGDVLQLNFPMDVHEHRDRNWRWFEAGPLLFSLPVEAWEVSSGIGRFAPRSLYPRSAWNQAPLACPEPRLEMTDGTVKLHLKATAVSGFDELEQQRYTPPVPLYCRRIGPAENLTLIPYGDAPLRITAFPDAQERRPLFVYQALVSERYPYDWRKELSEQRFLPEDIEPEELRVRSSELFASRDGYYDLLRQFGPGSENVLVYVTLRFIASGTGTATFSVGASTAAEFFVNREKRFEIEPGFNAEFMAGLWFNAPVVRGYNLLTVKVGKGFRPAQYPNAWGVRADIFETSGE